MIEIYPTTTFEKLRHDGLISVRAYNSLCSARLYTVEDVFKFIESGKELINLRNLGPKSELEIEKILKACNLITKERVHSHPFDNLPDKIKNIINSSFESVISDEPIINKHIRIKYPDVKFFFNSLINGKDAVLEIQKNLSKKENIAFRKWHIDVINKIIKFIEDEDLIDDHIYQQLSTLQNEIKRIYIQFSISDIISNFITNETDQILQNIYDNLCIHNLSVRGLTFKKNYLPSYRNVIPYFDKTISEYSKICPGHLMKKTILEIYGLVQLFKAKAFSNYEHYADLEVVQRLSLKKEYPYLSGAQRDFLGNFIQENSRRPILYLLYNYIRLSNERKYMLFSLCNGLFDGIDHSIAEVATLVNLSRERVRQIINDRVNLLSDFTISSDEIDYYKKIFNSEVITSDSIELKYILNEEHLPIDFSVFASLYALILNFEICHVLGKKFLISPVLKSCLNLKSMIEKINKTYNKGFAEDTLIHFSYFTGKIPSIFHSDIKVLLTYILKGKKGVYIRDTDIFFEQNKIDIEKELFKILNTEGKPLHVEEIFTAFKLAYPNHKFTSSSQIKPYLFRNPHIQAVGKQSIYGLDSWDHIYFGNIRELLLETLERNVDPMHISDIYKIVKEYFPSTTIKSLMSSMGGDSFSRFIQFEDGYFGLNDRQYSTSFVKSQNIPRFKFEQRVQMFRSFVDTYHRFPFFNGGDEEASLQRWLYNATHDNIDLSEDEIALLNVMLKEYLNLGYPQTSTEYEFLSNCSDYKRFISKNHRLPTNSGGSELYQWFNRSKENALGYHDQRYNYFTDLCNFITSLGFSIN